MTILVSVNIIALAIAGLLTLVRLVRGPSALDRAVAIDVLTAVVIALAVWTLVISRRADVGVIVITLTMVAFVSSTVIGRFGRRYRGTEPLVDDPDTDAKGEL
ncbi:cation:proton antiporter [Nanchangia anserum]|uniref:Cation:proton antiporter n=1 Tax=Nanchangia anserum TaxID=2692125 RepID=A0A8I0KNG9_9ACTO|nr:monovalent cation/H+ antiporter complex subunit F [Nanchangia anserum]MBD3689271.1 cation:proton antiporter [Nanchangia anserum]QOX81491.1 cation:proton antiporter [Nanchangia anserum]